MHAAFQLFIFKVPWIDLKLHARRVPISKDRQPQCDSKAPRSRRLKLYAADLSSYEKSEIPERKGSGSGRKFGSPFKVPSPDPRVYDATVILSRLESIPRTKGVGGALWIEWFDTIAKLVHRQSGQESYVNSSDRKNQSQDMPTTLSIITSARMIRVLAAFATTSYDHAAAVKQFLKYTEFESRWLDHVIRDINEANDHTLTNIIYSHALIGISPSQKLLKAWYKVAGDLSSFQSHALSLSLWSLAKLYIRPPESFIRSWYVAFRREASNFDERGLANMVWSFGKLGVQPSAEFLALAGELFERSAFAWHSQALSNFLWGLAKLQAQPNVNVVRAWSNRFLEISGEFSSRELSISLWSFATLDVVPPRQVLRTWAAQFEEKLSSFDSQNLANSIWAIAKLNIQPTESFLKIWTQKYMQVMKKTNDQELSNAIYSLVRLGYSPGEDFVNAWEAAFLAQKSIDLQAMSNSIRSFAMMKRPLSSKMRRRVMSDIDPLFRASSVTSLVQFISSIIRYPDVSTFQSLYRNWWTNLEAKLEDGMRLYEFIEILTSCARFEHQPPPKFLLTFYQQFVKRHSEVRPAHLSTIMHGIAKLQLVPPSEFVSLWFVELYAKLKVLVIDELSVIIWSLARLSDLPQVKKHIDAKFRNSVFRQLYPIIDTANSRQVNSIITGMTKLGFIPSQDFLTRLSEHLSTHRSDYIDSVYNSLESILEAARASTVSDRKRSKPTTTENAHNVVL